MTDPAPTLREAVENAIGDFLAANGGGIPTGFIAMVEWLDADGDIAFGVMHPDTQPTYKSMGFNTYLNHWFADDARIEMAAVWETHADEEDD